jgi:protein ImuB
MRRVISVWLPTLPTDRIKRREPDPPDAARVTITQAANSRILASVDQAAAAAGLQPGMTFTQARIYLPGLLAYPADPDGDAQELRRLADWSLRYAPLVGIDPPDGLWIDVTGATHLHGGEDRLLRDVHRSITDQGLACRAAIADTPGLAHATARFGHAAATVVPPEARLPDGFSIDCLRLDPRIRADLRRLGIRLVHHLATIPRGPITRRFGRIITLRLDQAAGRVFEPITPVVPHTAIQARQHFVEPLLTAEAFTIVIETLTGQVCQALTEAGQGARRLDLLFERVDGSIQPLRIGTARPVRDPAHLTRMLVERLEQVDPGLGVEAMRLIITAADPHAPQQVATSLFDAPDCDLAPLLDRLANRIGASRLYRLAPIASHIPERSVRRVPATDPVHGAWPLHMPRPVRLLEPPQTIDAITASLHHIPTAFTWRRVRHHVRRAEGPERIGDEWWQDSRMPTRDYFRVEDEQGRRYWLFRCHDAADGRWFLHGFF